MSNFLSEYIYNINGISPISGMYGVEIEIESHTHSFSDYPLLNGWSVTEDGSLRVNGIEYVMSSPKDLGDTLVLITNLYSTLQKSRVDFAVTGNAGIHVHINMGGKTVDEVLKFIYLLMLLEDILVHWCGPSREGNLFCLRGKDSYMQYTNIVETLRSGRFTSDVRNMRYSAINLASLFSHGSIELRCMPFSSDPERVIKWVYILDRIKDVAETFEDLWAIYSHVNQGGTAELLSLCELGEEFGEEEWKVNEVEEAFLRTLPIANHYWRLKNGN